LVAATFLTGDNGTGKVHIGGSDRGGGGLNPENAGRTSQTGPRDREATQRIRPAGWVAL